MEAATQKTSTHQITTCANRAEQLFSTTPLQHNKRLDKNGNRSRFLAQKKDKEFYVEIMKHSGGKPGADPASPNICQNPGYDSGFSSFNFINSGHTSYTKSMHVQCYRRATFRQKQSKRTTEAESGTQPSSNRVAMPGSCLGDSGYRMIYWNTY